MSISPIVQASFPAASLNQKTFISGDISTSSSSSMSSSSSSLCREVSDANCWWRAIAGSDVQSHCQQTPSSFFFIIVIIIFIISTTNIIIIVIIMMIIIITIILIIIGINVTYQ